MVRKSYHEAHSCRDRAFELIPPGVNHPDTGQAINEEGTESNQVGTTNLSLTRGLLTLANLADFQQWPCTEDSECNNSRVSHLIRRTYGL